MCNIYYKALRTSHAHEFRDLKNLMQNDSFIPFNDDHKSVR
jgi:hypothetical protein